MEADPEKRKQLVWDIERKLAEDVSRPVIFYPRGATCRKPELKGLTIMVNSIYNGGTRIPGRIGKIVPAATAGPMSCIAWQLLRWRTAVRITQCKMPLLC
jgi:hypothetical protein